MFAASNHGTTTFCSYLPRRHHKASHPSLPSDASPGPIYGPISSFNLSDSKVTRILPGQRFDSPRTSRQPDAAAALSPHTHPQVATCLKPLPRKQTMAWTRLGLSTRSSPTLTPHLRGRTPLVVSRPAGGGAGVVVVVALALAPLRPASAWLHNARPTGSTAAMCRARTAPAPSTPYPAQSWVPRWRVSPRARVL